MRIDGTAAEGNHLASNGAASQPRLVAAAHEFEAQMMKELLKPLEQDSVSGEGSDDEAGSGGILGYFATEALGRSLSQSGGLGIAHRILGELGSNRVESTPGANTARQEGLIASFKE